jgi:hypothetical protein
MYLFESREEGFFVSHENGRGVAHVTTKTIGETNDPNLKVQKRVETPLPREKWQVHFTGFKLSPAEVEAFVKGLAAQPG